MTQEEGNKIPQYKLDEQKKNVELFKKLFEQKTKYFAVEYAGYWHIQDEPFYGGRDILNAEEIGQEQAAKNAKYIADLLNQNPQ